MIATVGPYRDYKLSRIGGLPHIPSHWREGRARYFFHEIDERSLDGREVALSVSHLTGVTSRGGKNVTMVAESNEGHKLCDVGDIVINTMWAWMGAAGVARQRGIVSPSYGVYRPIRDDFDHEFLDYLIRTPEYIDAYTRRSTGIHASRLRLYPDQFLDLRFPCPPPEDQRAIVRFLKYMDGRIRRCIAAKKKLIALLNEQKQAIIHRAVTRGLDSDVPLNPSGVEWLGDIPAHWNLSRVKNEFVCINSRRVPLSALVRGEMVNRTYAYYGASGVIDKVENFIFDDELLLIAEDGANLALRNLPLAIIASGKFWVNNHAHILKPRTGNIHFLAAVMEGLNYEPWISGAAQPKLTKDRLMSIAIAVPNREAQDNIMAAAAQQTRELSLAIPKAERELRLLREFRTRLIADVVIGRLDIREAAAHLPEESENAVADVDEPLDETVDDESEAAKEEEVLA